MSAYELQSPVRRAAERLACAGLVAICLFLTACASGSLPTPLPPPPPAPAPTEAPEPAWAAAIMPEDHERLRGLADAWATALARARAAGHGAEIAALGALGEQGAALPDPLPPPGRYRCRTIKIGGQGGLLDYVAYGWFECEIARAAGVLRLDKLTGSQRQHGRLYPDTDHGLLFLGSVALGSDETTGPPYGADRARDVVGVIERVGPARWRLVQPWPRFESILDLLELAPL